MLGSRRWRDERERSSIGALESVECECEFERGFVEKKASYSGNVRISKTGAIIRWVPLASGLDWCISWSRDLLFSLLPVLHELDEIALPMIGQSLQDTEPNGMDQMS